MESDLVVLASRLCIFHVKITVKPNTVNKIVKTICLLRNMLQANFTSAEARALLEH